MDLTNLIFSNNDSLSLERFVSIDEVKNILRFTNFSWFFYLLDPDKTGEVQKKLFARFVVLFGHTAVDIAKHINDLFTVGGFIGYATEQRRRLFERLALEDSYMITLDNTTDELRIVIVLKRKDQLTDIPIKTSSEGFYKKGTSNLFEVVEAFAIDCEVYPAPFYYPIGHLKYAVPDVFIEDQALALLKGHPSGSYVVWINELENHVIFLSAVEKENISHFPLKPSENGKFFESKFLGEGNLYRSHVNFTSAPWLDNPVQVSTHRLFDCREAINIDYPWSGTNYEAFEPVPGSIKAPKRKAIIQPVDVTLLDEDRYKSNSTVRLTLLKFLQTHLEKRGIQLQDLHTDFKDGFILAHLAELLTSKNIPSHPPTKNPPDSVKQISESLELLKSEGVLVECTAEEIHQGKEKTNVRILWNTMVQFLVTGSEAHTIEWAQETLLKYKVTVKRMWDFKDGVLLYFSLMHSLENVSQLENKYHPLISLR